VLRFDSCFAAPSPARVRKGTGYWRPAQSSIRANVRYAARSKIWH